ncbi:hypothetical protein ACFQX4_26495 [Roseomonas sp. GCM10028921]
MPNAIIKLCVSCLWLTFCGAAAAETLSAADKAALQAAMTQHVERQLVNGNFLHLDAVQGTVRVLFPAKTHPRIMQLDKYYVLCTDFRDQQGTPVNVDFYLAPGGKSFAVFQTEVANRAPLQALVRAGRVRAVE